MLWRRRSGRGRSLPALRGNPYLFLGPRPFREARLRSYIVNQHRAGRPLREILDDDYVRRCGSESFCWQVLQDARTIRELEEAVRAAIEASVPNRARRRSSATDGPPPWADRSQSR
jgi:hypothetical protein